jgi:hypothetical protein
VMCCAACRAGSARPSLTAAPEPAGRVLVVSSPGWGAPVNVPAVCLALPADHADDSRRRVDSRVGRSVSFAWSRSVPPLAR